MDILCCYQRNRLDNPSSMIIQCINSKVTVHRQSQNLLLPWTHKWIIPYSRKYWQGIKLDGLAVFKKIAKFKPKNVYSTHWTTKAKQSNQFYLQLCKVNLYQPQLPRSFGEHGTYPLTALLHMWAYINECGWLYVVI